MARLLCRRFTERALTRTLARLRAPLSIAAFATAFATSGCRRDASNEHASSSSATAVPDPGRTASAPQAASGPLVLAPTAQVRWTEPPSGTQDIAAVVRKALAQARDDHRTLIVYVGATWCEPCQRFHHAVDRGELDSAFPDLTVIAFDVDRDGEALATAGYVSKLIPLFAVPNADGRASGRQIEGSVKGEQAVAEITPRLRALVTGGS